MTLEVSQTKATGDLTAHAPNVDFSFVLTKSIEILTHEPPRFRQVIYELARVKLQQECLKGVPLFESLRLMFALESAIISVERKHSQLHNLPAAVSPARAITISNKHSLAPGTNSSEPVQTIYGEVIEPTNVIRPPAFLLNENRGLPIVAQRRIWPIAVPLIRMCAVGLVAVGLYIVIVGRLGSPPKSVDQTTSPGAQIGAIGEQPQHQATASNLPVPSVYGIYAVSDGKAARN